MRFLVSLSLALILSITSASAQHVRTSASGYEYSLTCNSNGYVLTPTNPLHVFADTSIASSLIRGTEVIFLGRSCDAFSQTLGGGTWCWANGGFSADLGSTSISFPRQELYCARPADLGSACRC